LIQIMAAHGRLMGYGTYSAAKELLAGDRCAGHESRFARRACVPWQSPEGRARGAERFMGGREMGSKRSGVSALAMVMALAGCATQPQGPMVQVMPAPNKPFEVFVADQNDCKQYADQQVAGQVQPANNQAVGTAVVGTILGAGLGAAIGGGQGAAIGAASGAVGGTAVGASGSQAQQGGIQRQYDNAYAQCMYAKGNQVPGTQPPAPSYQPPNAPPPPPPADYIPPPPDGRSTWQPGYWLWNGYQYQWVAGRYGQRPTPGAVWIPDHWQQYQAGWAFIPGHWQG
jgi:uncharacterized protein YcfJ